MRTAWDFRLALLLEGVEPAGEDWEPGVQELAQRDAREPFLDEEGYFMPGEEGSPLEEAVLHHGGA